MGGKNWKIAFYVFLAYFWYGLIFTNIRKVKGKLIKNSNTFIWQDLRFFCPKDRLAISDKITCQIPNFICQTLEKSLQFADQTYKLRKCICFQVFHKIWFFLAKKWIGNIFLNFANLRWNFFFQTCATSIVFAHQLLYWYFLFKIHLKSTISRGEQSEITVSFWIALVTPDSWPISVHGTAEVRTWKTRFEIELSLKWVFIPCLIQI